MSSVANTPRMNRSPFGRRPRYFPVARLRDLSGPPPLIVIWVAALGSVFALLLILRCIYRARAAPSLAAADYAARTVAINSSNTALAPTYTPVALSDVPPPYTAIADPVTSGGVSQ
ncbi:hypothetical protein M427DRAFT_30951 [Gonapodya prolifera JEL478]|uniref:Uncharacterized protein n=1 Tax=Gonapodya prolifera (strain JEL478) TaxID=1344416 RepID=A0A139AJ79_GONPJ|nr:hypothetical protein M427DRAFT_30951 [Gonapodya prolifera JEL478]|eukprot:KXS16842.1 hypothetical protein M427DRAFT_30951 [Gonapodya prolifera JEL478]